MIRVDSRTRLCCLLGDPVTHSVSPQMHNAAFSHLELNFCYMAFRVVRRELPSAVEGVRALGIRGFNVTVPHKVEIIPLLDEVDETARKISAVNTVLNKDGRLIGFNTDGAGFIKAVGEDRIRGKNAVMIGAGGAARAIAFSLAGRCRSLTILNRTSRKAVALAGEVERTTGCRIMGLGLSSEEAGEALRRCELLINSTIVGMYPDVSRTIIDNNLINPGMVVFDAVFNPAETRLLREARLRGAYTVSGLEMLVHQGAEAFKIWTGAEPPLEVMREAAVGALKSYGTGEA
ncbi:MAG: shikimate dehydrogenase [Candidatus Bathyarchaeia archaeon]